MTTIVSVRRDGHVVIGGDGQVTLGNTVMKGNAKKSAVFITTRLLLALRGGLLMPLLCSSYLNASWKCIKAT